MNHENCPFCGCSDLLVINDDRSNCEPYWVKCLECTAWGPIAETKKEAWEKWDERTKKKYLVILTALEKIAINFNLETH